MPPLFEFQSEINPGASSAIRLQLGAHGRILIYMDALKTHTLVPIQAHLTNILQATESWVGPGNVYIIHN